MSQSPVGLQLVGLTLAVAVTGVTVLWIVALDEGWERRKLLKAFIYLTAVVLVLTVVTVIVVDRELGFSWLRWLSPVGLICTLVMLILQYRGLRNKAG